LPPPLPTEISKPVVFKKKLSEKSEQENQENNENSFVTPKKVKKYEPRQKSRVDIALSDILNKGSSLKRTEKERYLFYFFLFFFLCFEKKNERRDENCKYA